jgi:hypothetical protein
MIQFMKPFGPNAFARFLAQFGVENHKRQFRLAANTRPQEEWQGSISYPNILAGDKVQHSAKIV